jgi:hypothetical protein
MSSQCEEYVFSRILPNTIKGCFYGFIQTEEIIEDLAELDQNNNIGIHNMGNYSVIEVNPPYLINAVNSVNPNTFCQGDIDVITKEMANAVVEFEKFLVTKGKANEGFKSTIAIYSTNKSPTIMYNNTNYPAFRLSLAKALAILKLMGYSVNIGNSYVPIDVAISNINALWDSLKLSPIKNGIFLNIKCTLTTEQMKQKELELKQKYN